MTDNEIVNEILKDKDLCRRMLEEKPKIVFNDTCLNQKEICEIMKMPTGSFYHYYNNAIAKFRKLISKYENT